MQIWKDVIGQNTSLKAISEGIRALNSNKSDVPKNMMGGQFQSYTPNVVGTHLARPPERIFHQEQ